MIVCICENISESKIRQAVAAGAVTMPQLRDQLGVGTCCGKCHPHAKQMLRESLEAVKTRDRVQVMMFQRTPVAA